MSSLVESDDLDLQTMPELVGEASRLREELSKLKEERDRMMAGNKVVLVLKTEISESKKTTASIVGSLQMKGHAVETKRDLKKALDAIAVLDSRTRTFNEKVISQTEK